MCPPRYRGGGSLLNCLFTLTADAAAVYFCCTGLRVAPTGCYPASCPLKPGLSSRAGTLCPRPRSHAPLTIHTFSISETKIQPENGNYSAPLTAPKRGMRGIPGPSADYTRSKINICSHIKAAPTYKFLDDRVHRDPGAVYGEKIIQEFQQPSCLLKLR